MKVLGSIFNDLNCGIRIDKLHEYDYNISWFITLFFYIFCSWLGVRIINEFNNIL